MSFGGMSVAYPEYLGYALIKSIYFSAMLKLDKLKYNKT